MERPLAARAMSRALTVCLSLLRGLCMDPTIFSCPAPNMNQGTRLDHEGAVVLAQMRCSYLSASSFSEEDLDAFEKLVDGLYTFFVKGRIVSCVIRAFLWPFNCDSSSISALLRNRQYMAVRRRRKRTVIDHWNVDIFSAFQGTTRLCRSTPRR